MAGQAMSITSARLPTALKKRVDRLAAATDRSRTHIIQAAIESYLDVNEWQVSAIKASLADERPNLRHEDVLARLKARLA
jgi:RHH-type transcriptional regulator, rel operon repressor / antitoxin RelB